MAAAFPAAGPTLRQSPPEPLPPPAMQEFAFFDLDGTLLPHDTQLLFANHVFHREPWRRVLLAPFLGTLPLAGVRLLDTRDMKRLFCGYLCGMSRGRLDELAREFAESSFRGACFPEVLAEVDRHRRDGRTLVLNTASPAFYATHLARVLGFDHCVATGVEIPEHGPVPLVPWIDGANNKRSAKLPAMAHLLPEGFDPEDPTPLPGSYAYTDSIVDLPLLSCAEHKVTVNPHGELREASVSGGWRIIDTASPYSSPRAKRLASARQLAGLFPPPADWSSSGPAGSASS